MTVIKFQFDRYDILCQLLKKRHTKVELLEKLNQQIRDKYGLSKGISERTLVYDINHIESQGAEIHRPSKTDNCYYFTSQFNSKVEINDEELDILRQGISILRSIKGFSIAADMQRFLRKIESSGHDLNTQSIIAFEDHNLADGTEHIENIIEAIKNQIVLTIQYAGFNDSLQRTFDFSPIS